MLWALGLFTLLIALATGLAVAYEEDVKEQLLGEINKQLRCRMDVDAIEFTLIERFPRASLKFTDIVAFEALPEKVFPDTLLHAEQLFLEFSPFDLIGNEYTVKNVVLRNATMHLAKDPQGQANFQIWESSGGEGSGTTIEMEKVLLENVQLAFVDSSIQFSTHLALEHATISAEIGEALLFEIDSELQVGLVCSGNDTLALDRSLALETRFKYDKKEHLLVVENSSLKVEEVPLTAAGTVQTGQNAHVELLLGGKHISLEETRQLMPFALRRKLDPYGIGGDLSFNGQLVGPIGNGNAPVLELDYRLREGQFTELSTNTVFDRVDSDGELRVSAETIDLRISELSARSGPGIAELRGNIEDLVHPKFDLDLMAQLDLERIQRFFRIDTLEKVGGQINLSAKVSGKFEDPSNIRREEMRELKVSGQLSLDDALLKLKGKDQALKDVNGLLLFHNNDAAIKDLQANLGGTDLELNGTLRNLIPYAIVPGEILLVEANLHSSLTDLNGLLESGSPQSSKEERYHLEFPKNINVDLNASIEKLVFRRFEATNISGVVTMSEGQLKADPIKFRSSEGSILAELSIDGRNGASLPVKVKASLNGIAIDRLFHEFEDFGQGFIQAGHLKGTAKADVIYRATLKPNLKLDPASTYSLIDISIANGELVEHAPLVQVAHHVRKNKLVAPFVKVDAFEDNLRHVRFSELHNQIEIKDRTVHIPAMQVNSSALNIEMAGTHTFDGHMDHHINFRMSDLLRTGKTPKEEFGPIVDDGTGSRIYLHMYGPSGQLAIESDRNAIKEDRQEYMAQEKENVKAILQEELGLFKGQQTGQVKQDGQPSTTFSATWDADSTAAPWAKPAKDKKKKGWKFLVDDTEKEERFTADEDDEDF